jgi:CRP/FNR family transcriptional regulator
MPVIEQIRQYPLFAGLTEDELTALSPGITKRSFAKGAYIYHPGAPGLNMYLIESGMVRMFFVNHRWEEFLMNLLTPPGCFGLPLLPDNQVRITGAAAVRDTVALSLSREVVFDAMRRSPQFAFNIYLEMSNGIRALGKYVHGVATLSVLGRLASVILFLSDRDSLGKKNELDLPISQGDLASLIGSSRGRVNRALAILEKQGLIRVEEQKIYILDRPGLAATHEV